MPLAIAIPVAALALWIAAHDAIELIQLGLDCRATVD